jgi:hypothetical protein
MAVSLKPQSSTLDELVAALPEACRRSWKEHWRLLCLSWAIGITACTLAVRAAGLYYFFDFRPRGMGPWAGSFTVLSAFCLAGAGLCLLLVARRSWRVRQSGVRTFAWTLGGIGGVYLGLDDLLQIHEAIARRLAANGVPRVFGLGDQDVYVFFFYGVVALFVARFVGRDLLRWNDTWLPGLLAVGLAMISLLVDLAPWEQLTRGQQAIWGPVEEVAKTLGAMNLALMGMLLVEVAARSDTEPASAGQPGSADLTLVPAGREKRAGRTGSGGR